MSNDNGLMSIKSIRCNNTKKEEIFSIKSYQRSRMDEYGRKKWIFEKEL